ncbi:aspartic peptidase domain-containing protein [Cercophora samala]|uniref:Aspartic peptidase domain-containing protein n=1 Tax=Cercophora samala TaxID=330535 RepID=A0AA40D4R5_9PEZI|nr:aspartic peptidase domain-containing protein [Cercophora samala]
MAPTYTRLSTVAVSLLAASATTTAHVLLPFSQHPERDVNSHQLSARNDGTTQLSLTSDSYAYLVEAEVGTPAQKMKLLVSPNTGHSWVMSSSSSACMDSIRYRFCSQYDDMYPYDPTAWGDPVGTQCTEGEVVVRQRRCLWGTFNASLSSTYLMANQRYSDFSFGTTDGSVSGDNMTDHLKIGDLTMEDYPMGLITSADVYIGVLGLGFNTSGYSSYSSYSTYSYSTAMYTNFIDRLVQGGKSKTQAYSMWLDSAEGKSGGLLFGAVDRSRYTGDLVRMSGLSEYLSRGNGMFGTVINTINGTLDGELLPALRTHDFPLDVWISPSDVFSFLPGAMADQIAKVVGATWNTTLGGFVISCDASQANAVEYRMELGGPGGPVLHVETGDLIVQASVVVGRTSSFPSVTDPGKLMTAQNLCYFGIQKRLYTSSSSSTSDRYSNIGSSLLRRSYLVFDLSNHEIAIARAKFPSNGDRPSPDIVPFSRLGAKVPGAKRLKIACTSSYGCSDVLDYDDEDEHDGDSGSRNNNNSWSGYGRETEEEADRRYWRNVAIGLGVGGGILCIVAVVAAVVVCRRIKRAEKNLDEEGEGSGADSDDVPVGIAQAATINRRSSPPVVPMPVIEEKQEGPEVVKAAENTKRGKEKEIPEK